MGKADTRIAVFQQFQNCACTGKSLARIVQPAVLVVLALEPLHGYVIVQRLMGLKMFQGQAPDASGVYGVLRSMEAGGLVTANWNIGDSGPAKRCFKLTDCGRACLERWIPTLEDYVESIEDLLVSLRKVQCGMRAAK